LQDKNPGDKAAEQRFKATGQAYQVLSSPELRRRYDTHGEAGVDGAQFVDSRMIFMLVFGCEEFEEIVGAFPWAVDPIEAQGMTEADVLLRQDRRVVQVATTLAAKLEGVTCASGQLEGQLRVELADFKEASRSDIASLVEKPLGKQLAHTIGECYSLRSRRYIGDHTGLGLGGKVLAARSNIAAAAETASLVASAVKTAYAARGFMAMAEAEQQTQLAAEEPGVEGAAPEPEAGPEPPWGAVPQILQTVAAFVRRDVARTLDAAGDLMLQDADLDAEAKMRQARALGALGEAFLEAAGGAGRQAQFDAALGEMAAQIVFAGSAETEPQRA
jgi:curved DNA-binding protein CbpA